MVQNAWSHSQQHSQINNAHFLFTMMLDLAKQCDTCASKQLIKNQFKALVSTKKRSQPSSKLFIKYKKSIYEELIDVKYKLFSVSRCKVFPPCTLQQFK